MRPSPSRGVTGAATRRRLLAIATAVITTAVLLTAAPATAASPTSRVDRWWTATQLATGERVGVKIVGSALVLDKPRHIRTYNDPYRTGENTTWEYGAWTSPWYSTGFNATNLVPSWSASMPNGTWLRVLGRVKSGSTVGSWDVLATWAYGTGGIRRASGTKQPDDLTSLDVDTLKVTKGTFQRWQIRVDLMRPRGSTSTPKVESIGATTANYATRSAATSKTSMSKTKVLAVPGYSQMTHRGHFPQWGGGGEAWCSPTSVAMVVRFWGSGPKKAHYSWAKDAYGMVDHAARYSYDHRYQGTGNWPFSVAYAGRYGLDSFVTRLRDLRDAEAFIKAGIPLVVSVAFKKGQLTGAPISSTPGHLMVIRGFTADGRVVAGDPAASSNSGTRRIYSRAQFEKAWLSGSGGISYVIRPGSKKLPPDTLRW